MNNSIFVTGDAGFIGSYFTYRLIDDGWTVFGLDLNPNNPNKHISNVTVGSILDKNVVYEQMKKCSIVLHLAAKHHEFISGPQKGLKITVEDYYETNVKGTKILLEIASRLNITRFIFLSSVAVYGNNMPSTEETVFAPVDDYGKSKAAAEELIKQWVGLNRNNKALIIRPVVVFGINNWANVYNLIDSIAKNRFLQVGKGENKKAMAYVANLYDAVWYAWEHMQGQIEIYNYSDYPILDTATIINIIFETLNKDKSKVTIPYSIALLGGMLFDFASKIIGRDIPISSHTVKKFCSNSIHYSDLIRKRGFKQYYSIKDGLKEMIEWYKVINGYK